MTKTLTPTEMLAKERVCLALDVPTVSKALSLVSELSDFVGTFKIGKQLHTAAGNQGIKIVDAIKNRGGNSFLDLKLHDTPNTVYDSAKECTVPGVYVFNIHVAGGENMCKQAFEGAYEAAESNNITRPKVIGVTVLTSLDDEDLKIQGLGISYDDLVMKRTELARNWKLDGVVCAAKKAGELEKRFGSDFTYVTPGIKWKGKEGTGQKQLYTPDKAVQDCNNSILVIGSAITKAENKRETAYEILQAMAPYMKA